MQNACRCRAAAQSGPDGGRGRIRARGSASGVLDWVTVKYYEYTRGSRRAGTDRVYECELRKEFS